ncbi:hypothetical protein EJB05_04851 [Eragrostis curvula]|uniref:Uncharacterized protein n=1 Tax=Eragrostis curvula TaxID=38414 RepID=A0A5J9WDG7_9POAL|nr:hypothetical protein EJB05_04851 [Eragrostis curvula]
MKNLRPVEARKTSVRSSSAPREGKLDVGVPHHLRPNGADPPRLSPRRGSSSSPLAASTVDPLLLFPTADAAWPSSMLTIIGNTVIPGIVVALALRIAVPRVSTNRFFSCAFLRHIVSLTVILIMMNWFQAAQGGQPALLNVAPGVIGFVALNCLWKMDGMKQPMGKAWDWNMYGTKLKKIDGRVLDTANEDGERCEDDTTAPAEDQGDDPEDGSSGPESLGGSDDEILPPGLSAVQLLAICANFPIGAIFGSDGGINPPMCMYFCDEGEEQEDGMVDLVPIGPCYTLSAISHFIVQVAYFTTAADNEGSSVLASIIELWVVGDDEDEPVEYTQTICAGLGRKLEITYLVIPDANMIEFEVRLKLKDLGSRSRVVYGKIKANTRVYGNKSVHLFNRERGRSLSLPSDSTSILPLRPPMIAVPGSRPLKLHIEVDLTVITTFDSHEEEKNLKFSLEFTGGTRSLERELDDDGVEVNIYCSSYF